MMVTESQPKKYGGRLFGHTPTLQTILIVVTLVFVGVVIGILAPRLRPCRYRDDKGDDQTASGAYTGENETDTRFLQSSRDLYELVMLFVDNGDGEHES